MADKKLLRELRGGVAEAWDHLVASKWREDPKWRANLTEVNLFGTDLTGFNLRGARLRYAILEKVSLVGASLIEADLRMALLGDARLDDALLSGANFFRADCRSACFRRANLSAAYLVEANLCDTFLDGAFLGRAEMGKTILCGLDLSTAEGLASVKHEQPSLLGIDTLVSAGGRIPPEFLRGCGLSDWEIEQAKLYNPALSAAEITDIQYEVFRLRTTGPIQINPVFLSHSSEDHKLVKKLHEKLQNDGIRCWLDTHCMTAGPVEDQIDRAIRTHPTVILVLSEASVESDWVMWEAEKARELEKRADRPVLCPIALDKAWKDCKWPGWLRSQIKRWLKLRRLPDGARDLQSMQRRRTAFRRAFFNVLREKRRCRVSTSSRASSTPSAPPGRASAKRSRRCARASRGRSRSFDAMARAATRAMVFRMGRRRRRARQLTEGTERSAAISLQQKVDVAR